MSKPCAYIRGLVSNVIVLCLREQQRMELKGEGNPSNPVTPVKIPDCPVPASLLDELLKPSASVNKEPLNNLHSCLRQLKYDHRPAITLIGVGERMPCIVKGWFSSPFEASLGFLKVKALVACVGKMFSIICYRQLNHNMKGCRHDANACPINLICSS